MIYTLDGVVSKTLLTKFSLEKIVHAKRNDVFSTFSNYEQFEKLIPQFFPSIRIRSVRGDTAVVEEHFHLGEVEFLLMSKHVSKPFVSNTARTIMTRSAHCSYPIYKFCFSNRPHFLRSRSLPRVPTSRLTNTPGKPSSSS